MKKPYAIEITSDRGKRYILVDEKTGEILDDAQGYGYKTIRNAYAAWAYRNGGSPEKKEEKEQRRKQIRLWIQEHPVIIRLLEQYELEVRRGDWGPKEKFNAAFISRVMKEQKIKTEFTGYEIWRVHRGK